MLVALFVAAGGVVIMVMMLTILVLNHVSLREEFRAELEKWLTAKGYRLLHWKCHLLFKGPFWNSLDRNEGVFSIVAEDSSGGRLRGWARRVEAFGKIEVIWENETDQ